MRARHRAKGVKREHRIIKGLLPVLEHIAAHPAVTAVIPGRIKVTQSTIAQVQLRLQTRTISGLKLGAWSRRSAQEVFVVTAEPEAVLAFLRDEVREFLG